MFTSSVAEESGGRGGCQAFSFQHIRVRSVTSIWPQGCPRRCVLRLVSGPRLFCCCAFACVLPLVSGPRLSRFCAFACVLRLVSGPRPSPFRAFACVLRLVSGPKPCSSLFACVLRLDSGPKLCPQSSPDRRSGRILARPLFDHFLKTTSGT